MSRPLLLGCLVGVLLAALAPTVTPPAHAVVAPASTSSAGDFSCRTEGARWVCRATVPAGYCGGSRSIATTHYGRAPVLMTQVSTDGTVLNRRRFPRTRQTVTRRLDLGSVTARHVVVLPQRPTYPPAIACGLGRAAGHDHERASRPAAFKWNHNARRDAWAIGRRLCAFGKGLPDHGGDPFGIACFEPNGDKMNVLDMASDGYRVGMRWQTPTQRGICVNTHGREGGGTVDPFDAVIIGPRGCQENLYEGHVVRYWVVRCDGSRFNCRVLANWDDPSSPKTWKVSG